MATRPFPSFLIYIDRRGEFRWHFQAANQKITADGSEGYRNYDDCLNGIRLLQSRHPIWQTQEVTNRLAR
jgi:uncharacterized protein YegP (UPF0339 family)